MVNRIFTGTISAFQSSGACSYEVILSITDEEDDLLIRGYKTGKNFNEIPELEVLYNKILNGVIDALFICDEYEVIKDEIMEYLEITEEEYNRLSINEKRETERKCWNFSVDFPDYEVWGYNKSAFRFTE